MALCGACGARAHPGRSVHRCLSDRRERRRSSMQMGPALLPTPLSPARGLPSGPHPEMLSLGSTWRPMSFRVPEGPRSVTGARAGIRFFRRILLRFLAEATSGRHRTPSISPRPVHPWMVALSGSARPRPDFPFDCDRISRPWLQTNVAWSPSSLASGRSLLQSALAGRVDSRSHIDLFRKSQVFQTVGLRNSKSSFRLDVLRLRFESESDKRPETEFSTFSRFRCGGRWITQRVVDSAANASPIMPKTRKVPQPDRL